MAKEKQVLITVKDIRAVRFKCPRDCGGELVVPIKAVARAKNEMRLGCGLCTEILPHGAEGPIRDVCKFLHLLDEHDPPSAIRFEIDA
ncbi:MAG: hypothetical protein OXI83_03270 [Gemmatimonadota bacterium]|nr:hypothetical protein [Gemmatimonadota bacterium]